jgi:hypothetical protein
MYQHIPTSSTYLLLLNTGPSKQDEVIKLMKFAKAGSGKKNKKSGSIMNKFRNISRNKKSLNLKTKELPLSEQLKTKKNFSNGETKLLIKPADAYMTFRNTIQATFPFMPVSKMISYFFQYMY